MADLIKEMLQNYWTWDLWSQQISPDKDYTSSIQDTTRDLIQLDKYEPLPHEDRFPKMKSSFDSISPFEPEILDDVVWPFNDIITLADGSTDIWMYWEVNGRRMTDEEYRMSQGIGEIGTNIPLDFYINYSSEKEVACMWLESKFGGSQRSMISHERATFISACIPLTDILSLSDEELAQISEILTSFDIMRPEDIDRAKNALQWYCSTQDVSLDWIDTQIATNMTKQETFVFAKIKADLRNGVEYSDIALALFLKQIKERKEPIGSLIELCKNRYYTWFSPIESQKDIEQWIVKARIWDYRKQFDFISQGI